MSRRSCFLQLTVLAGASLLGACAETDQAIDPNLPNLEEDSGDLTRNLMTDPHNCGTVGHDCNHDACIEGACTPTPYPFYCAPMTAATCNVAPQNADLYCYGPDHHPGAN